MRASRLTLFTFVLFFAAIGFGQTFAQKSYPITQPVSFRSAVDRADFNNDGNSDLIVTEKGGFSVLLNQGTTFSADLPTAVPNMLWLEVGDFNNDRLQDVAVCIAGQGDNGVRNDEEVPGTIQIMLGDGAGHFRAAGSVAVPNCRHFGIGDFNGDGRLDVVVAKPVKGMGSQGFEVVMSNTVIVEMGDGQGGFNGTIETTGLGSPNNTEDNACTFAGEHGGADINHDGSLDLLVSEVCDDLDDGFIGGIAVLLNDGSGHFNYKRISDEGEVRQVRFRDVNQDGRLDLLVTTFSAFEGGGTTAALLFTQNSDGTFSENQSDQQVNGEGSCGTVAGVESLDADGDGFKDFANGEVNDPECQGLPESRRIRIVHGTRDGTFSPATFVVSSDEIMDLVWGDLNHDGKADIAALETNNTVEVFTNTTASAAGCSDVTASLRSVTFCMPANGGTATSPAHVLANIAHQYPISAVKIYVDGVAKYQGFDDLLSTQLDLATGTHKLTVKAWDFMGPFSTSNTFTVSASAPPPGTCSAPSGNRTVHLCTPANGSTVSSPVRVTATLTDAKSVTVKIYVDGVVKFTGTSKQVDQSFALAAGSHHITVKGWDSGSSSAFSATTTFTVH